MAWLALALALALALCGGGSRRACTAWAWSRPSLSRRPLITKTWAAGYVPAVPYYPDKARKDYQWMDIYNALGRDRTLFVSRYLDDEACNQLVASLVWLQSQSRDQPITLFINSPGGMIHPALAIFDVIEKLSCPLVTINMGLTVGVSALLCAAGTRQKRFCLPNARFLMSRAGLDDGVKGSAQDLALQVGEVMRGNERAMEALATLCDQPLDKIRRDLQRDFYLTAPEAVAYGVVDQVLQPAQSVKIMRYRGEDDDVVGFGHFSEARKVKSSPMDVVHVDEAMTDERIAGEMQQRAKKPKGGRIDPRSLKNGGGASRFANSRCKPPGANKPKAPQSPSTGSGNGSSGWDNPFKNTGF